MEHERNYRIALDELIEAIKGDEDMEFLVENMVKTCKSYIEQVDSMPHAIEVAKFRCNDGADYRAFVQQLDASRRRMHDSLMGSVNAVIRLGKLLSVTLIPQEFVEQLNEDREKYYSFAKVVSTQCV